MIDYIYQTLTEIGYTHPLHPTLTHVPIGLVMGAFFFAIVGLIFKRTNLAQSAWIYFRNTDLQQSVSMDRHEANRPFRFWPVGTTMVIESYQGNAFQKKNDALIEIAVMSKAKEDRDSSAQAFYPGNWIYARFNPDRRPSITSAKVRKCHQCHSIAFHLTGDLVFTHFP